MQFQSLKSEEECQGDQTPPYSWHSKGGGHPKEDWGAEKKKEKSCSEDLSRVIVPTPSTNRKVPATREKKCGTKTTGEGERNGSGKKVGKVPMWISNRTLPKMIFKHPKKPQEEKKKKSRRERGRSPEGNNQQGGIPRCIWQGLRGPGILNAGALPPV